MRWSSSEQASLYRLFVVREAEKIADLVRRHGPRPPIFSGEDAVDTAAFMSWLARVALLANGYEPAAAHGDTYSDRRCLAKGLLENWKTFFLWEDAQLKACRERTGEHAPADGVPAEKS